LLTMAGYCKKRLLPFADRVAQAVNSRPGAITRFDAAITTIDAPSAVVVFAAV